MERIRQFPTQPEVTMIPANERPVPTPEAIVTLIRMGGGTLHLWSHLLACCDAHGVVHTTRAQLSIDMEKSERAITNAAAKLRKDGWLEWSRGCWKVRIGIIRFNHDGSPRTEENENFSEQATSRNQNFSENQNFPFNENKSSHSEQSNAHVSSPSQPLSPHTPLTRENDVTPPFIPPAGPVSEAVKDFFGRYPVGHKDWRSALRAWIETGCEANAAGIMAGLDRWIASESWTDQGGRWIPNADKFLRQEKWRVAPPPPLGESGYRSQAEINAGGRGKLVL